MCPRTPPAAPTPHGLGPNIRIHLGSGPIKRGGGVRATVVGGLFEDPMIVLRLDHRQRCLFLDLGEVSQVPTRIVHQATDLLVTHAHLDHIGDFPWLLRRLVGVTRPLRLFGPPGIATRVDHLVHAFTWDRIGDRGPRFEVHELIDGQLERWHIQAGIEGRAPLDPVPCPRGVLLDEPRLRVRAATLDHGGIPVLAYAIEEPNKFDVRGDVLRERGWRPGPWLGHLKTLAAQRRLEERVTIPREDGGDEGASVEELHDVLLLPRPGQKLVYATDFANTPANREAVIALAQGADALICEASFTEADREQAARTGHLCARDCAEVAAAADVGLLVPFHLSARYEDDPSIIYRELLEVFERVHVPEALSEALRER